MLAIRIPNGILFSTMGVVHVKAIPKFDFGEDAVLLAADHKGLVVFQRALSDAVEKKNMPSHLVVGGIRHEFDVSGSEAHVELQAYCVIWHLPDQKASEILDKLATLVATPHPAHHYVDIDGPAETLILSLDEYLDSPIFA